jgi:hypothetical protein
MFNVFIQGADGRFAKLKTILSTSEITTGRLMFQANGSRLSPLTNYTLRALALSAGSVCDDPSESALVSDVLIASTTEAGIPSSPPRVTVLTVQNCTITLAFSLPEDLNGSSPMTFRLSITPQGGYTTEAIVSANDLEPLVLHGLLEKNKYSVACTLVVDFGETISSELISFTTGSAQSPSQVSSIDITGSGASFISIQWNPPVDSGGGIIQGFRVYKHILGAASSPEMAFDGATMPQIRQFNITGLVASTTYGIRVVAINQYNLSGSLDLYTVTARTTAATVPSPPTILNISHVIGGSLALTFNESRDFGGSPTSAIRYHAFADSLVQCFSTTNSCSQCSHTLQANENGTYSFLPVDTAQTCAPRSCSPPTIALCCFSGSAACGIPVRAEALCSTNVSAVASCEFRGLNATTSQIVTMVAENGVGNSMASSPRYITTR